MNIALIGLGSMGQAVERVAEERGHKVVELKDANVAIDFSSPEAVFENVDKCREAGVSLVMGTTGWYDEMDKMKEAVGEEIGFMWSSNFSIGVNLYFRMIKNAAKLINQFDEYDVWGHELHHNNKKDSPSGTAKTIEKILLANIDRKDSVVEDKLDRKRKDNEIHFSSLRGGAVNFEHTIGFDSSADTIKISHAARNRDGYALGSVKAAEWLADKKGFFTMDDFLNI